MVSLQKSDVFFIYLDLTLDGRVFYVGKGLLNRVQLRERRNTHWKHITEKHGWKREVILATKEEVHALEEEKRLIREYKTFYGHPDYVWGANKTEGGEGTSGHKRSPESIIKQRLAQTGKKRGPIEKLAGKNHPQFGKRGNLSPNFGQKRSADFVASKSGENSVNAVFTWELVYELRERYRNGERQADLARHYGVTPHCIYMIVHEKTWKITDPQELPSLP